MRPREMQGSELSEEKTRNYEPTTAYHEAGHAVAAAVSMAFERQVMMAGPRPRFCGWRIRRRLGWRA